MHLPVDESIFFIPCIVISKFKKLNFEGYNCIKNVIFIFLNIKFRHTCNATGLSFITSDASFKALDAFISPSAAITLALASLEASASAAIAR